MTTIEDLAATLSLIGKLEGGPTFMGIPDRWFDDAHWRCVNDHVSVRFLKSTELGDLCLACQEAVKLTFPEDVDGPIRRGRRLIR